MAAAAATGLVRRPALARTVQGSGKRVLQIFLHGGSSQLETWEERFPGLFRITDGHLHTDGLAGRPGLGVV